MSEKRKIAIVTGAGSGIGRATSIALSNLGWTIVMAGRTEELLTETASLCGDPPNLVVKTDITSLQSVERLFKQTEKTFGRLNLLFNNAGISASTKPLEEISLPEWQKVIDINVTGTFLCIQQAFKLMKRQDPIGGRIINNGSISAHVPRPFSTPYSASKHAITGLTKAASLEGREFNIAVGQIDIGNATSQMTRKMEKGIVQANGTRKVEPTIKVEDVADTVAYMANLPLETNVPFITVMANKMPYIGRG